jgi:hypothetical protein
VELLARLFGVPSNTEQGQTAKIVIRNKRSYEDECPAGAECSGKILMVALFVGAAVGVVLASCLTLVNSQNQAVARSQAWNACIPVIEAGIEEAMAHLNNEKESTLAVNGWEQNGSAYSRYRAMGDGFTW